MPVSAQEVAQDVLPAAVVKQIEAELQSQDPIVRGEAALALAPLHRPGDVEKLVAIARDPAPQARRRGLLALGYHGRSGVDVVLLEALRAEDRPEPERIAAAFALGLLRDDLSSSGFDELLKGKFGSGFRKDRLPVLAFLLALTAGQHPQRSAILEEVIEDAANRDPLIRRLALRTLSRDSGQMTARFVDKMLQSRESEIRVEMLAILASQRPSADLATRVEKIAGVDPTPAVRAAALEALIAWRRPLALELSAKALKSNDPDEASAGLRGCLSLAGGYAREAADSLVQRTTRPELRHELLRAWRGTASKELRQHCVSLAADRRQPIECRVAATELLVETKDERARTALVDLFFETAPFDGDPMLATRVARGLARLEPDPEVEKRLRAAASALEKHLAPLRVAALVRARHPAGANLATELLADGHLEATDLACVLRALACVGRPDVDAAMAARISDHLALWLR